jgi:hypothetical protein
MLSAALDYVARGFAVFKLPPRDKIPFARSRGFKDASLNPATIRNWFSSFPYNIGIATGMMSGGIVVLDVDGEDGAIAIRQLQAEHEQLPATLTSRTSRGRHFWFRTDQPIPSSVSRIGPKLDVRAEGAYCLAPPSIHPSGFVYCWENDLPLAPLPDWLSCLARKPEPKPAPEPGKKVSEIAVSMIRPPVDYRPAASLGAYGRAALEEECNRVASAIVGTRNNALNRASFSLHQLVAAGELDQGEVYRGLMNAAVTCGLMQDDGPRQVEATINSGRRAGFQNPRRRPA